MLKKHRIITIDGPAASGKSTIAQTLAKKLGFYYLYTGLLYRAVAYVFSKAGTIASIPDHLDQINDITYQYHEGHPQVLYQGKDITFFLHDGTLAQQASLVSADECVRKALLPVQRSVAQHYDIIADGRDCGSIVFPHADVKFFLTADVATRALRIFNDHKRKAGSMTLEQIKDELAERDNRDQSRCVAPLIIPEGAVVINNAAMDVQQTVDAFLVVIDQKIKR